SGRRLSDRSSYQSYWHRGSRTPDRYFDAFSWQYVRALHSASTRSSSVATTIGSYSNLLVKRLHYSRRVIPFVSSAYRSRWSNRRGRVIDQAFAHRERQSLTRRCSEPRAAVISSVT